MHAVIRFSGLNIQAVSNVMWNHLCLHHIIKVMGIYSSAGYGLERHIQCLYMYMYVGNGGFSKSTKNIYSFHYWRLQIKCIKRSLNVHVSGFDSLTIIKVGINMFISTQLSGPKVQANVVNKMIQVTSMRSLPLQLKDYVKDICY